MYKTKTIKREIYHIIIPMILENILQISANLVTTAMVGRLLANDIAAQGICVRITDTLWVFYKGVAIGATVLIAKAYGTGKKEDCRKIMEQTLLTELILVFVFQVVLFFRADIFLGFFSKDAEILMLAQNGYIRSGDRTGTCTDLWGRDGSFPFVPEKEGAVFWNRSSEKMVLY